MKKFLFSTAALALCLSVSGQVDLQGTLYDIDTLKHIKAGPGTMHTAMLLQSQSTTKKMRVHVLTMDLNGHDNVEYRMEIGNDTTLTTEYISGIARRKSDNGTHYFAGVNADFFITTSYVPQYAGQPHMDCILDGEIASTGYLDAADYGHFFMDKDKNMWCDNPSQSFSITFPDGSVSQLPRINQDIYDDEIVLFNSKYGRQTRVAGCTDVQLVLADGYSWAVNKPLKLVVNSSPSTSGTTPIITGGAVLSATGSQAGKIASLEQGDTLTAMFSITLQDHAISPEIKECSGGDVVILKRGEVIYEAPRFINSRDSNNPRTMFGYDKDRTKMVWCVIDGRTSLSDGSTYPEGADLMKFLGCYDALNVDGGGSSGMYLEPFGIVNNPSDGSERAVSNGLFAVLNAPEDNTIAEIRFVDWAMTFPKYGSYTPTIYGYNQYGLLIDTDVQGFTLSCPESLGEITNDGTTFFGNGQGSALLTATYNGVTSTLPVTIDNEAEMELNYNTVLIDNYRRWPVALRALVGENYMTISPEALAWSCDDETVASIDNYGILYGLKDGQTTIHGSVGDYTGSVSVTVQCPTDRIMPIEPGFDPSTWTITKSNIKTYTASAAGNGITLDFTLSSTRGPQIKLAKDSVMIWSLPDAIRLRINPVNVDISRVTVNAQANNGTPVNLRYEDGFTQASENVIEFDISSIGNTDDLGIYPIRLNSITIEPKGKTATEYRIEMPGIEAVYNNAPSGICPVAANIPVDIHIDPDRNIVSTNTPAEIIEIYNLTGQLVTHATKTAKIQIPSPGYYIIKITSGDKVTVKKILL